MIVANYVNQGIEIVATSNDQDEIAEALKNIAAAHTIIVTAVTGKKKVSPRQVMCRKLRRFFRHCSAASSTLPLYETLGKGRRCFRQAFQEAQAQSTLNISLVGKIRILCNKLIVIDGSSDKCFVNGLPFTKMYFI